MTGVIIGWYTDRENVPQKYLDFIDEATQKLSEATISINVDERWPIEIEVYSDEKAQKIFKKLEDIAKEQFGIENYSVLTTQRKFKLSG